MRIAVSAMGPDLDATVSPFFGRCPYCVFVNQDTMEFEALQNPSAGAAGGAGIQAAQMVASRGAEAVLTGNVGPSAFQVLQAAGIPVFAVAGGTVRQAVETHKAGQAQATAQPTTTMYAGMGSGFGQAGGMRMGTGRGMGRSRWAGYGFGPQQPIADRGVTRGSPSEAELSELKGQVNELRAMLDEMLKRLEGLKN